MSLPGTSTRLQTAKFAGLLQQHLRAGEVILDSADASIEVFEITGLKMYLDLAVVLTSQRLIGFRGRGMLGGKSPFVINLDDVTEVDVTRQNNVQVKSTDAHGFPGLWKVHLGGDEAAADRWMVQIHRAATGGQAEQGTQAQGSSPEWQACRDRLQEFCSALTPFSRTDMIGQLFGEGLGLEQATSLVKQYFVDANDVREADTMVVGDLIVATGKQIDPEDVKAVMGVSAVQANSVTAEQAAAARSLAAAATVFIGQFNEDGANMWELWKARDDVAAELLSWHAVARLRLATIGKLDPV